MRIALDVHGGDYGIRPNIEGALLFIKDSGAEVILVGDREKISAELKALGVHSSAEGIRVVHSSSVAEMGAEAVQECKDKPDCTIMVCADLIKKGEADAMLSAGNSGAVMVAAFLKLGRIPGVARPAIAVPLPTVKGHLVLIDGGANTESKPLHLLHFAVMGSVYARHVFGIENPTVGIVSVGEEETKGNELTKESIQLLKKSGLNFYGPIEGRDIPFGTTDVVVCDGFVGNVSLKLAEGMGKAIFTLIKREVDKRPLAKLGALLMKPAFRAIKKHIDPDQYGGAPVLGVNGIAIICHGKSNAFAIYNGLRAARNLVKSRANEAIIKSLRDIKELQKELSDADKTDLL